MVDQVELKPCPFCGSEPSPHCDDDEPSDVLWRVMCACSAAGPWRATEADAIAEWNKRSAYNPNETLPGPTGEVIDRILQGIASEERDSGGPDDGNSYHTFTTRISDVKALIAAVSNPNERLREALERIAELEKDRARYQWLANAVLACDYGDNEMGGADSPDRIGWSIRLTRRNAEPFIFGQSIDEAIDAALTPPSDLSE